VEREDLMMVHGMMDSCGAGEKEPQKNWKIATRKKMG
jgi:hypothetical protein